MTARRPPGTGRHPGLTITALATMVLSAAAFSAAAGCSTAPAFSTRFPDNQQHAVGVFADRVSAPQPAHGAIAVGASSEPAQLFAFDMASRQRLWQVPAKVTNSPMLAGPRVITQEGDRVVGRDTRTGRRLFAFDADNLDLNGVDGDARRTVVTLSGGGGTMARGRVVLLVGDAIAWERAVGSQVGVPALAGGTVVVPWSSQFITGLDSVTGEELARIRIRDGVVSHAIASEAGVVVGSQYGVAVLDRSLAGGNFRAGRHLLAPERDLPGRPLFLRDAYDRTPALTASSARNRIRLDWAPAIQPDGVGLANDVVYLTFYRFVFALSAPGYNLRWVYTHGQDIVGATATDGGLAFAADAGGFGFLHANSGVLAFHEAGNRPITSAALPQLAGFAGGGAGQPDSGSIRRQLAAAAQDPDTRLVPIRMLALEMLAEDPSTEATAELLALCDSPKGAPMVRRKACDSLQSRVAGGEFIIEALGRHYGYLEGTSAPPVGALAQAAAVRQDSSALPLLLEHLTDPHTPSRDLAPLVSAIAGLGGPEAVAPIAAFLRLYHADPIDEHMVKALEAAVKALTTLGGEQAAEALGAVGRDGLTTFTLRRKAADGERTVVAKLETEQAEQTSQGEQTAAEGEPGETASARVPAAGEEEDGPPARLTLAVVNRVLYPVRSALRGCLDKPQEKLFRARVILVVTDGELELVSVLPKEIEGCVQQIVKAQTFPRTRYAKRETITYTIKRR